jgi:predicted nucleic-acid-binding protein
MSSAVAQLLSLDDATSETPRVTTLLELVHVLGEITDDEREIVATVLSLLRSGKVRLCGNFRDTPVEDLG